MSSSSNNFDDSMEFDEMEVDDEMAPPPVVSYGHGRRESPQQQQQQQQQQAVQPPTVVSSLGGAAPANDPAVQKRRAIQEILRDTTLSDLDKRLRIQNLMDGRPAAAPPQPQQPPQQHNPLAGPSSGNGPAAVPSAASAQDAITSCVHYQRNCLIIAPCCNRAFGCRICHDETTAASPQPGPAAVAGGATAQAEHGPMDRFAIREVICKQCHTRQSSKTNNCIQCGIQFGEYHCMTCNLFMAMGKHPFHCDKCGFCRVGGRENFNHCDSCCMCISNTVYAVHNCMRDKYKNDCPVCREDMFSSRQAPQDLPCGHAIHSHCFRKLASFDYRCPICKKTVVCKNSMEMAWAARARDIELQPMPADLRRVVNIMCNDCETKSLNREWHFLGVQCPGCRSFNTIVEQVVSGGDDSAAAPINPTGAGAS